MKSLLLILDDDQMSAQIWSREASPRRAPPDDLKGLINQVCVHLCLLPANCSSEPPPIGYLKLGTKDSYIVTTWGCVANATMIDLPVFVCSIAASAVALCCGLMCCVGDRQRLDQRDGNGERFAARQNGSHNWRHRRHRQSNCNGVRQRVG